jgi:hypothetical protein
LLFGVLVGAGLTLVDMLVTHDFAADGETSFDVFRVHVCSVIKIHTGWMPVKSSRSLAEAPDSPKRDSSDIRHGDLHAF